jgi:hypothetical protein
VGGRLSGGYSNPSFSESRRFLDCLRGTFSLSRRQLREEFVEELEDACDDDPGMLLAGAVDNAIKETMER